MFNSVEVTCCQCKEPFGMRRETEEMLRRSQNWFYCPFGHKQYFPAGKTEAQKLREQLDAERRRRESAEQNIEYYRQERDHERRRAASFKGQATRLRGRARAGICPCCNRHFKQLAAHMANKHPDFAPEAPEEVTVHG